MVRVAFDAMGGDHGADRGRARGPRLCPSASRRRAHPRRRYRHDPGLAGDLPANITDRPCRTGHRHGRAPRARHAREEGRHRSSSPPSSSGRAKPMRSSPPATPGAGMAAGILQLGRLPGSIGLASPSRWSRIPARWSSSTSVPTRTRPPTTSPSTRGWGRSSRRRSSALPIHASRCSASARRRARAMPGSSVRPSCSTPRRCGSWATSRARPHQAHGRRRRHRCSRGQRRHQVLRGAVVVHLRPVAGRVPRVLARPARLPADAPEHRPDPLHLRLRDPRRLAAARREGHRDHHARPGEAAHDRVRLRRRRDDGPDTGPGADRRSAAPRTSRGSPSSQAPRSPRRTARRCRGVDDEEVGLRERTRADRRPGCHRRARRASLPSRSRASPASATAGPAWRALARRPGRPCSRRSTIASSSGSASSPGRVRRSARSTAQVRGPRSPRRSSGCSGSTSARSTSSSMVSEADRQRGPTARGRRLALAAIFEADFGQRTAEAHPGAPSRETERDPSAADLARELVAAVVEHRDAIDARINRRGSPIPGRPASPRWTARCSDRPSVRCYTPATPARVAIAEWVELARTYSGEPMRRLMNGVLGSIAR